jgi:hypothetical protein
MGERRRIAEKEVKAKREPTCSGVDVNSLAITTYGYKVASKSLNW